jgi:signal recognition particle subunit SRP54
VNFKVAKISSKGQGKGHGRGGATIQGRGLQFVKIVYDELCEVLGSANITPRHRGGPACPVMLIGLQGSGKTSTCAKLAIPHPEERTPKPLLRSIRHFTAPADHRSARQFSEKQITWRPSPWSGEDPVTQLKEAKIYAMRNGYDR